MYEFGGSPIGNSRVKLTNIEDCIKKGYVSKGQDPLEVAAGGSGLASLVGTGSV